MILDVGCGFKPRGDINCDFSTKVTLHNKGQIAIKVPNFVKCDALHLPFRDKTFDLALCYHLIEHVPDPVKLIRELMRVAFLFEIRCPHRLCRTAKANPMHIHFFKPTWFRKILPDADIIIRYSSPFSKIVIPYLFWPNEIIVQWPHIF